MREEDGLVTKHLRSLDKLTKWMARTNRSILTSKVTGMTKFQWSIDKVKENRFGKRPLIHQMWSFSTGCLTLVSNWIIFLNDSTMWLHQRTPDGDKINEPLKMAIWKQPPNKKIGWKTGNERSESTTKLLERCTNHVTLRFGKTRMTDRTTGSTTICTLNTID